MINLNVLACILGGVVLVGVWLKFSRSLRGFLWCLLGIGTIYVLYRSDGQFMTMVGIVVAVFLLAALFTLLSGLATARRRRVPVYRSPRQVTRSVPKR